MGADLKAIFSSYASIYPKVVSRRCDYALDELISQFKIAVSANPQMRSGITFVAGLIVSSSFAEPDNILILLPTQFDNPTDVQGLSNPAWYDTDAKKNIIFFYAGSIPPRPVGNLYEAVENSSWGTFSRLEVYNSPQQEF